MIRSVNPYLPSISDFHFVEGETLLFNKPIDWTSFDVVNKVRWLIRNKLKETNPSQAPRKKGDPKLKVGHAGTLDPLASGLLIVCTGKNTKSIDQLANMDKEYTGTFVLGGITDSYDTETPVSKEFETSHILENEITESAKKYLGKFLQHPPPYSARSIDGVRAYTLARKGENPKLEPREVSIQEIEIDTTNFLQNKSIGFRVVCSKGTYIRSLVHDIGNDLNNGAYLTSLIRTRIGQYLLKDAWEVTKFTEMMQFQG